MPIPAEVPVTLEELKAELQENPKADAANNALLERLVGSATRACEGVLGYRIVQAPHVDTLDGGGITLLRVRNPPADLQHVYEDTERVFDSTTELHIGVDFVAEFWKEGAGVGTGCRILRRLNGTWPEAPQSVRVEYLGGWPWDPAASPAVNLVPEDIRRAIFLTARRMRDLQKGLLGRQAVTMPGGGGVQLPSAPDLTAKLPKEARELLEPYGWNSQAVW